MRWEDGALVIDIDEVTVPVPSRLKGQVRLTPSAICGHEVKLDPQGLHVWRPVAPFSRIEADFDKPGAFMVRRRLSRFELGRGAAGGEFRELGVVARRHEEWRRDHLRHGAEGRGHIGLRARHRGGRRVAEMPVPPRQEMPTTFWRMARHMRAAAPFKAVSLLEDLPFYARTLLRVRTDEGEADAFHESLSLARFRNPVVQAMLPFRMPRRG